LFRARAACTIGPNRIRTLSSTTKRTLGLLLWLGLVGSSIWPIPALDGAFELARAPLSALAELASPLAVLRRPEVQAAQRDVLAAWREEAEAGELLLAAQARLATPTDPALVAGRRLVHAEVVGPSRASADLLLARVRDVRGLAVGLPVVHGAVFVGRVRRIGPAVDLDADKIEIELVTSKSFRVGARARDEVSGRDVDLIVGGLDEPGSLAVQSPSDRELFAGMASVNARLEMLDPSLRLAQGYLLGRVRRVGDEQHWSVAAELDYRDGLFHLVVLAEPDQGLSSDEPMPQALADQGWRAARPLSHGDPSPWRETLRLSIGSTHGARSGAALAFGARLIGRLGAVGPWSADALLPGDPGFHVVAVALFDGDEVPRVLGRLISLGRDARGAVHFRASGGEPLALAPDGDDGCRAARLFTGAGDAGVPSGLLLGDARVPVGPAQGLEDVRLARATRTGNLRDLWVRVEIADADSGGPERGSKP
jgi:hypothetical protein